MQKTKMCKNSRQLIPDQVFIQLHQWQYKAVIHYTKGRGCGICSTIFRPVIGHACSLQEHLCFITRQYQ